MSVSIYRGAGERYIFLSEMKCINPHHSLEIRLQQKCKCYLFPENYGA